MLKTLLSGIVLSCSCLSAEAALSLSYNPFQYSGSTNAYSDEELPTSQYLEARYYDMRLMRFDTRDSTILMNRYGYGNANPIMNVDPTGYMSWQSGLGLGVTGLIGLIGGFFTSGISSYVGLAAAEMLVGSGSSALGDLATYAAGGKMSWAQAGIDAGIGGASALVGLGIGKIAISNSTVPQLAYGNEALRSFLSEDPDAGLDYSVANFGGNNYPALLGPQGLTSGKAYMYVIEQDYQVKTFGVAEANALKPRFIHPNLADGVPLSAGEMIMAKDGTLNFDLLSGHVRPQAAQAILTMNVFRNLGFKEVHAINLEILTEHAESLTVRAYARHNAKWLPILQAFDQGENIFPNLDLTRQK